MSAPVSAFEYVASRYLPIATAAPGSLPKDWPPLDISSKSPTACLLRSSLTIYETILSLGNNLDSIIAIGKERLIVVNDGRLPSLDATNYTCPTDHNPGRRQHATIGDRICRCPIVDNL
jgi:hypothetical protein